MIEKQITYIDYNGVAATETFRFHLKKVDLVEMGIIAGEGFDKEVKEILENKDVMKLMKLYKDIIAKSYGVKTEDGKGFIKSPELSKSFEESEAYDVLFMELVNDGDKALEFFKGILPSDFAALVDEKITK